MEAKPGSGVLIEPVARVRSPFDEKFGIPRQAGLAPSAIGELLLLPPYNDPAMMEGLDGFSHLWLTFRFDRCVAQGWRPRVRPPRLGGNREVGVWASRSPFRPNFLGLSAVRLLEIIDVPEPVLKVGGLDLLNGTPVFDIKPYLPYADAISDARGGFAPGAPDARLEVHFSADARRSLEAMRDTSADASEFEALLVEVLSLDPRPAYRQGAEPDRIYGVSLSGYNVRWCVGDNAVEVVAIEPGAGGLR